MKYLGVDIGTRKHEIIFKNLSNHCQGHRKTRLKDGVDGGLPTDSSLPNYPTRLSERDFALIGTLVKGYLHGIRFLRPARRDMPSGLLSGFVLDCKIRTVFNFAV
jgi:hypothetical protein